MTESNRIDNFHQVFARIEREIETELVGQNDVVRQLLIAIVCGGNVLLEGVPGLGKTRLVRTIGRVLDLRFARIQFTPDLMPADVTGTNIIVKDGAGSSAFSFQPGPIFANIVLADEINRATPKTQSALLEAMQEHTVTVGGQSYPLPQPFFVLATQNPMEQEGTYPLPEAQLDRFFFKLLVDFPDLEALHRIVDITSESDALKAQPQASAEDIFAIRAIAQQVPVAAAVKDAAMRLVLATHPESEQAAAITEQYLRYGASPRAAQALIAAARVRALMEGRFNVAFDDIRYVAYPVFRHRIIRNFEAMAAGVTSEAIIESILTTIMPQSSDTQS